MASGHFANSGFGEGRLQHLPPLYIEYTACVNVWGTCEMMCEMTCETAGEPDRQKPMIQPSLATQNHCHAPAHQHMSCCCIGCTRHGFQAASSSLSPDNHACPPTDQLYSHVAAIALALELHAQVVLPPALAKNRQGRWVPYPLDTLLATGEMIEAAQGQSLVLWRVRGMDGGAWMLLCTHTHHVFPHRPPGQH